MSTLLTPFLQICLLRLAPQDLPASGLLLGIALVAHTTISVLLSYLSLDVGSALLAGLADSALLCALTASLLVIHRRGGRVVQTLTALAGTGAIIGFVALPIVGWIQDARHAGGGIGPGEALVVALPVGWQIAVAGHVLRHALSVPLFLGVVVAVVFYWISIQIMSSLFVL